MTPIAIESDSSLHFSKKDDMVKRFRYRLTDNGIKSRTDFTDLVSEIQEANCEASKNDCEMQPRKKGTFICKEDFWFYPDRDGDSLEDGAGL
jgi:hypothetical protein